MKRIKKLRNISILLTTMMLGVVKFGILGILIGLLLANLIPDIPNREFVEIDLIMSVGFIFIIIPIVSCITSIFKLLKIKLNYTRKRKISI